MNLQWYPGHMAKAKRMIAEQLNLIDVVIELLDARLPVSSENPDVDSLIAGKPKLVVLNKADLADETVNKKWMAFYQKQGTTALLLDSIHKKNGKLVVDRLREILKDKIEKQKEKGMVNRSIKVLVLGIPNVGKSSFINMLSGRAGTITGDRPGVTKGKQWIRLNNGIELLDTPGILWPKFDNEKTGLRLAFAGSIKDEIMDVEELAIKLLEFLNTAYPALLKARYKLEETDSLSGFELLELIGRKRGFIVSGGEIDTFRAANIVLDEFRSAKIGRISLESPDTVING